MNQSRYNSGETCRGKAFKLKKGVARHRVDAVS